MKDPYSYQERVLLSSGETKEHQVIRLEFSAEWNPSTRVHPFGNLQALLQQHQDENDLEIKMHIASGATQESSMSPLDKIPILGDGLESVPVGPAGAWMHINSSKHKKDTATAAQKLLEKWSQLRLVNTPIHNVAWDTMDVKEDHNNIAQFFLPTTGAAWSADALQQSFDAMSVCQDDPSFFGLSALEWSNWLVEGNAIHKRMWWNAVATNNNNIFSFGIQFETKSQIPPTLVSQTSSCPGFGSRTIERIERPEEDRLVLSVYQVLRRPWANRGRLETWITTLPEGNGCRLHVRQVLPPFITPSWQSLEMVASETSSDPRASVEWRDDGTSILSITLDSTTKTATNVTSPLLVSLNYEPAFLTIDDFPGDPNRGRELPPAVVTLVCPQQPPTTVFSNSILVLPPVPDMSMPFNVLSMTCSLYAYIVGAIVQILVKKASEKVRYKLHPEEKPKSKFQKLKEKIRSKFSRQKTSENSSKEEQPLNPEINEREAGGDSDTADD